MKRIKSISLLILFLCPFLSPAQNTTVIDSLTGLLKKSQEDTTAVICLCKIAAEYKNNDPDKGMEFANRALVLSEKIKYKKGLANSLHLLGMINSNTSNYDKALEYYRKSLKIREEIRDKRGISTSNNNIGLVYWKQSNYDMALKYYLISLKMDEEMGDKSGLASSYNNVGLIYWSQGNFDKAFDYFQRVIKTYTELKDKKGLAGACSNLGGVYYYQGKMDMALFYFKKALELYSEVNNKSGYATTSSNIAELYAGQERYDEALLYANKAYTTESEIGNKDGMIYALGVMAKIDGKLGQFDKALAYLTKAVEISKEINALKQLSEMYKSLAELYLQMGKYKEAYQFQLKFAGVKDSILNKETAAQIAEMGTKYETEQKSKEIELLKKEKALESITQVSEKGRNRVVRNSLIVGCLFILLIALLLFNRYKVKQKANIELALKNQDIEEQKEQIQVKNKEITDSIKYAKRIQEAILPPDQQVKALLPESFILYKPKDIVSGDFYWIEEWGNKLFIAAADCTGHGVPGAFMSIVGNNLLEQALNVFGLEKPFLILNYINKNLSKLLHQTEKESSVKDGMDIALLSIDKERKVLEFAGANNPLWIIRDGNSIKVAGNKFPVGAFIGEKLEQFTHHTIDLCRGDCIYIFTDGFADQFGGPKGKKYKYKQMEKVFLTNCHLPAETQKELLEKEFTSWKGALEQIDDVLIIGIKI